MHIGVVAACVALACAGCGDDTTAGAADLAAASDLAVPLDLARLRCADILACRSGCGDNRACQEACRLGGSAAARPLYEALLGCVAEHCTAADGGTAACAGPTDASGACLACLSTSFAQAGGAGAACHPEYAACAGS